MKPNWSIPPNHPLLTSNTVHVWSVTIDADPANINQRLSLLSTDEQRLANSFKVESPRRQFIVARAALRTLLGRYLGLAPSEISIESEENRKPHLAVQHASHDLQFNVAHSGDLALIAITRGTPIGIDVERRRAMRLAEPIAQRYFHPLEAMTIEAAPLGERDATFLRVWTMKEAILKAVGTGLTDRLSEIYVPLEMIKVGVWISFPVLSLTTSYRVRQLDVGNEYIAAVALTGSPRELQCMAFAS